MKGTEKAAALIVSLGEELAGEIMKNLKPSEITKITSTMVKLEQVTREEIDTLTQSFLEILEENTVMGMDGSSIRQ